MHGWRAILFTGCLVLIASRGRSEQLTAQANLVTRAQWVRFDVIAGRLSACQARFNQTKTVTRNDSATGIYESMSMSAKQHQTSFQYECTCPRASFTVDFTNGDNVEIQCVPRGSSQKASVQLRQDRDQGLDLIVGTPSRQSRYHADTIWHLLFAHPRECQQHLVPSLQRLRPDWKLLETVELVKQELLRSASAGSSPGQGDISDLVAKLGSHHHPTRRAADRQLRLLGQQSIGYLRYINQDLLSAEQRLRTRQILQCLSLPVTDTPQRVAQRMIGDRQVWTVLLANGDYETRCAAAAHLQRICGHTIAVDLHGSPEKRRSEVEQVRRRLGLIVK